MPGGFPSASYPNSRLPFRWHAAPLASSWSQVPTLTRPPSIAATTTASLSAAGEPRNLRQDGAPRVQERTFLQKNTRSERLPNHHNPMVDPRQDPTEQIDTTRGRRGNCREVLTQEIRETLTLLDRTVMVTDYDHDRPGTSQDHRQHLSRPQTRVLALWPARAAEAHRRPELHLPGLPGDDHRRRNPSRHIPGRCHTVPHFPLGAPRPLPCRHGPAVRTRPDPLSQHDPLHVRPAPLPAPRRKSDRSLPPPRQDRGTTRIHRQPHAPHVDGCWVGSIAMEAAVKRHCAVLTPRWIN